MNAPAHLRVLSNSEAKTFRRCAREHYLAYRLLKRPLRKAGPLRFGTFVHDGLEAWWLAAKASLPPAERLELALTAVRRDTTVDAFDLVRAEELLLAYEARWGDADLEVLEVEVQFSAPLVNPSTGKASKTFVVGGKIDALVRRKSDGTLLVVEHKTAGEDISAGSDYWRRLRIDAQVSTYVVGARSLGFDV